MKFEDLRSCDKGETFEDTMKDLVTDTISPVGMHGYGRVAFHPQGTECEEETPHLFMFAVTDPNLCDILINMIEEYTKFAESQQAEPESPRKRHRHSGGAEA